MLDLTKPLQTTDGEEVKLISKNGWNEEYPLGFLIITNDGDDFYWFSYDGEQYFPDYDNSYEIINKSTKVTKWMNIYKDDSEYETKLLYDDELQAKDEAMFNEYYVTTVKVEWGE